VHAPVFRWLGNILCSSSFQPKLTLAAQRNMLVPNLPPNVHDLLRAYIHHSGLRELPLPFTLRNATALHTTTHGVPITYKHRDTGETLQVNSYPWNSPTKKQQVVVATGRSLPEPVIIVPLQKRSSELKIWKGEHNPDGEDVPCPIYKVFGKEKPTGLTGNSTL
jgi:hypothetical protein